MNLVTAWKQVFRESICAPEEPFRCEWVSFGNKYPVHGMGNWDTPLICLEILPFAPVDAARLLTLYLKISIREDGMLAAYVLAQSDRGYDISTRGRDYRFSHPPIWTYVAKKILETHWDEQSADFWFSTGMQNLNWWENNRMDRTGLFWYLDSFPDNQRFCESGCEASPRWDFVDLGPFLCVDLSCQILCMMENLSFIAGKLGRQHQQHQLDTKTGLLRKNIARYFWDEMDGFFCDYDLTKKNARKTLASYWTLVSGAALLEDVQRMVPLLEDHSGFCADFGLTTVARSEPLFQLRQCRGSMWLVQVLWVCIGLQRYGLNEMSRNIAKRCLDGVARTFHDTGMFWEFYNPIDGSISGLTKETSQGPFPNRIGVNPICNLVRIAEGDII
jgi:hypothetical protein